jgi:hypothetical protein
MDPIRLVKFDIHGTEPVNTFVGEVHKLTDKTCPWVIPNASPFYADATITKVYDERGAELTRGRDYFLEEEFTPFCEVTGQSIVCFVRLSQAVLDANATVKIDYQSMGAYFVPRNDLDNWVKQMHRGKTPIDWSKIFNVPPTLPPSLHYHTIKTEITDWYELSWFMAYLVNVSKTRDPEANNKVTVAKRIAFDRLKEAKITRLAALVAHDEDYDVPHGTTKFDILMGNHDNFKTATLAEDKAGTRQDVLSTPQGVIELAKTYVPDTASAMYQGILPISRFGGDSFIPPNISGSFEGMGQHTECSGICLEPSGLVMLLSNHYDGRTRGLYFSTVENYNKPDIRITYTNYKYKPPVLATIGIDVDRIIAGSGNKVIMTGVNGTNDWFIALTNNTFDPGAHSYVRCDMSAVTAFFGSPYGNKNSFGNNDQATIHHMGVYLVLIQAYVDAGVPKSRYYRVLTEDVRAGRPVTWQAIPLTYVDWEGTAYNGVLDFQAQKITRNGAGKITRFGRLVGQQPFDAVSILRRDLSLSAPVPGSPSSFYLHVHQYFHVTYWDQVVQPPYLQILALVNEMFYIFNPATGGFTLQSRSPQVTLNFLAGADATLGYKQYDWMLNNLVGFMQPATVIFPTGEMVAGVIFEGAAEFPVRFSLTSFNGITSDSQLLSKAVDTNVLTIKQRVITTPVVPPATKNGSFPCTLTYEADGELFEATDPNDPNLMRATYYRKVSGGYAIREGVNNLVLGTNIYSRPLTTEIYKTNLRHVDGTMSITGDGPALAAGGVESGGGSLSYCAYSSLYPVDQHIPENPALRAPASGNVAISFPRTYTKTLDVVKKEATFTATSFYGFRQNVIDQILAYCPGATRKSFTITHLGAENGNMFAGLNHSIIMINWIVEATGRYRSQVLIARPNVEAPNADHPGVHLITSFTILSAPGNVSTCSMFVLPQRVQFEKCPWTYQNKPNLTAYRSGNYLKVKLMCAHTHVPVSTENTINTIFDLNLVNNQIENLAVGSINRTYGDWAMFWPGLGLTDCGIVANDPENTSITPPAVRSHAYTGGAASILLKTGYGYIVPTSVYPETGWVLFCQPNIKMMVNGSMYEMGGGLIDLRDVDSNPANKTFYVYATVEDDEAKYIVSTAKLRKSGNMLKAATITTNDRQILTIVRHQPLMVGPYLLSYTREGGIIPISVGFPQDEGDFYFVRGAELLP